MPATVIPFPVSQEISMVTTLKHALIIAAIFAGVIYVNNITGNKLGSIAA